MILVAFFTWAVAFVGSLILALAELFEN